MKQYTAVSLISSFLLGACVVADDPNRPVLVDVVHPVVIGVHSQRDNNIHVCTLKPFTRTYRSEHTNLGRAKLAVQKQCEEEYHNMFCEEKNIVCKTY